MRFHHDQLETLLTIVDAGTFEAAAEQLHISASAVSQRIRALETQLGQVLLVRSSPCRGTSAAVPLLRLARQQTLLHHETASLLAQTLPGLDLPVAVNADSLSTWFPAVLGELASWPGITLRLRVEDEGHTADLLRDGSVLGAVTTQPIAVQGCSVLRLGSMKYLPMAHPELLERHRSTERVRWQDLPMVRFNGKDELQTRVLRRHRAKAARVHEIPSSQGFTEAVRRGLGWGLIPMAHLSDPSVARDLVALPSEEPVVVQLFWQSWRLRSDTLDRLTAVTRLAARELGG